MEGKGGKSLNKEFDFRLWHSGWQGKASLSKEVDFRSWHCGKARGGTLNKDKILDYGIVEGRERGASE